VDAETVNKLLQINRNFYSEFNSEFSDSRSGERFNLEPLRPYLSDNIRVLDVGCGNGRLAESSELGGFSLDYLGIDGSAELIEHAIRRSAGLKTVRAQYRVIELTKQDWAAKLPTAPPFDLAFSLAVLHHIPSHALRDRVLQQIRVCLPPGGILVMSNWQFQNDARLRKKVVEWDTVGISHDQLEPDDYLLDWKRGGAGYRYVHLFHEAQVEQLAASADFTIVDQFLADNNLNLYSILKAVL
jgi:SAM-dependent methyltransferase